MAKNCCTIDMKTIWLRQLTHTIVEAFQQWWCFDEEKSIVQSAALRGSGSMEEALKGGNASAAVYAVAPLSGRTESTRTCENVFGLSVGSLRATQLDKSQLKAATAPVAFDGSSSIGLSILLPRRSNSPHTDICFWTERFSTSAEGFLRPWTLIAMRSSTEPQI
jgi:hypothetical protein